MKPQRSWVLLASFLLTAGLSSCSVPQEAEVTTVSETQQADETTVQTQVTKAQAIARIQALNGSVRDRDVRGLKVRITIPTSPTLA